MLYNYKMKQGTKRFHFVLFWQAGWLRWYGLIIGLDYSCYCRQPEAAYTISCLYAAYFALIRLHLALYLLYDSVIYF